MSPVVVTGIGAVSAIGDAAALTSWLREPQPPAEQREEALPARLGTLRYRRAENLARPEGVSAMAYRKLDRTGRMLLAAAREALDRADLDTAAAGGEIACSIGAGAAGTATTGELFETIVREGEDAASPFLFPNTVPNAAAGQLGIACGLTGPSVTVAGNIVAGETAILEAAAAVRSGVARFAIAGSVSEANRYYGTALRLLRCLAPDDEPHGPHDRASRGALFGEGCGVLILESEASARDRGVPILAVLDGAVEASAPLPPGEAGSATVFADALARLPRPDWWCVSASGAPQLDASERAALDGAGSAASVPRRTIHGGVGFLIAGGGLRSVAAVASVAGGFVPAATLAPIGASSTELSDPRPGRAGVVTVGDGGELVALVFAGAESDASAPGEAS